MNNKEVLRYFEQSLTECRAGIKSLRQVWDVNLDRYMCRKDFSKKKDWQFKVYAPIAKPKTKRAVAIIKKALLRAGDYFDFETPKRSMEDPQYRLDKIRCNYTKRLVQAHLDSRHCRFIDSFSESLEAAFGYSGLMVMKLWVGLEQNRNLDIVTNDVVTEETLALKCKAIDPFLFDFTPDGSIQIEHQYVTLPELWKLVDDGQIDEKSVKKLVASDYAESKNLDEEARARLRRLGLNETTNEYRKEVLLSHFWGPLISKDNKVQRDACHFIVANETFLLTEVMDNPYPDQSTPYIYDSPIKVPFRYIGKALTEDVNALEDAINDFVNIQCDNLLWNMLGINEIDQLALNPKYKSDLKELYPGKIVFKNVGYQGNVYQFHQIGADPNKPMAILQELKLLGDMDHGVTEYVSSEMPVASNSATEYGGKRQDAMGYFEGYATDLERGIFTRCIDKARDLILQYMADPYSDPNAQKILGEEGIQIDRLDEEMRKSLIVSEYNIVARGLSVFFERMAKVNNMAYVYKTIGALPQDALAWIKWDRVLLDVFAIMNLDNTEDKLCTPQEYQQKMMQAQQQQQQNIQLEIQKIMAPLQTKLQQTQMGINERLKSMAARLNQDMQKKIAELQSKEKDRQSKQLVKTLELAVKNKQINQDQLIAMLDLATS